VLLHENILEACLHASSMHASSMQNCVLGDSMAAPHRRTVLSDIGAYCLSRRVLEGGI